MLLWVLHNLNTLSKMKNQASTFLKQLFSTVITIIKAKSMAVKSKAGAIKTRLLIFSLLRNKKVLMSAISHKIHALVGHEGGAPESNSKAVVLHSAETKHEASPATESAEYFHIEDEDDDEYPDLRHSLFESEGEDEGNGSVIDLVRNSREEAGSEFRLEDEIDHVADVFIKRFHKQMRLQKMASFKRYQEMMEMSV